ncbi:hypothetical protein 1 [Drosophila-associated adintovirus 3]|uniref:Uncharacterized protein n=1 Tax=Drosophila-associated adintovirus 3 TaxID=2744818 RepID=A0A7D4VR54_9VIRU|nr:hypothetical protein 1 [Drosophila-associated adintovirus 3]
MYPISVQDALPKQEIFVSKVNLCEGTKVVRSITATSELPTANVVEAIDGQTISPENVDVSGTLTLNIASLAPSSTQSTAAYLLSVDSSGKSQLMLPPTVATYLAGQTILPANVDVSGTLNLASLAGTTAQNLGIDTSGNVVIGTSGGSGGTMTSAEIVSALASQDLSLASLTIPSFSSALLNQNVIVDGTGKLSVGDSAGAMTNAEVVSKLVGGAVSSYSLTLTGLSSTSSTPRPMVVNGSGTVSAVDSSTIVTSANAVSALAGSTLSVANLTLTGVTASSGTQPLVVDTSGVVSAGTSSTSSSSSYLAFQSNVYVPSNATVAAAQASKIVTLSSSRINYGSTIATIDSTGQVIFSRTCNVTATVRINGYFANTDVSAIGAKLYYLSTALGQTTLTDTAVYAFSTEDYGGCDFTTMSCTLTSTRNFSTGDALRTLFYLPNAVTGTSNVTDIVYTFQEVAPYTQVG